MSEVDKNYDWYKENLHDLLEYYRNQFIVIKNKEVIFSSKNRDDVIDYASKLKLGEFIIQKCEEQETKFILTRVVF